MLAQILHPEEGVAPEIRAILRSRLDLPSETNAPPASVGTNAPAGMTNRPAGR